MPYIRKFLDLSTAHLGERDKELLDLYAAPDSTVGPLTIKGVYGWFMYATDDPAGYSEADLPTHLRAISAYARKHGCDYVLFDSDAAVNEELRVFEACDA